MTPEEFDHALRLGLGRAIVWLWAHPSTEWREAVLHACTHNLAYDQQIDGSRHDYLFDLVQASGEPDWYYTKIVETLASPDNDELFYDQMLEMLRLWAEHGHPEARAALYAGFLARCALDDTAGDEAIIQLDGEAGLVFVADHLGRLPADTDRTWYEQMVVRSAKEEAGIADPLTVLEAAVAEHSSIAVFLERVAAENAKDQRIKTRPRRDPATVSYNEFRAALSHPNEQHPWISPKAWGRVAGEADLHQIAQDLVSETDPKQLRYLLQVFWKRPYPFDPAPIIALTDHRGERVAIYATGALEALPPHPDVRALALRLLAGSDEMAARAIGILEHQFEPGDHALVEALADRLTDPEAWHSYNFDAVDFYAAHPDPAGETRVMLKLYEQNPCVFCREKMVKRLIELSALPDWMAAECRLDAGPEIRKLLVEYDHRAAPAAAPEQV